VSDVDDPYLVPGTENVLHNKHGITNKAKLDDAESELAGIRMREFNKNPPPVQGIFDLQHLCDIHRFIFQDTYFSIGEHNYPIAGEKRVIGIKKKFDPDFPHPDHPHRDGNLHKRLDYAFDQLKKDNRLQGMEDNNKFLDKLVEHTTEIWECHPFREGNSRACKVFTQQLVRSTGRDINLEKILDDKINYREAMKVSVFGNPAPLKALLERGLTTSHQQVREKTYEYGPVKDAQAEVKTARDTIAADTEKNLIQLKAPLQTEKKQLELKTEELKTQLDHYNKTKPPLLGKSNHRNVGLLLETRLVAAKHDLYEFNKKYKVALPRLRKQAARIAETKHPGAVAILYRSTAVDKVNRQVPSRSRTKPNARSN